MKYCENCGNAMHDTSAFCTYCGYKQQQSISSSINAEKHKEYMQMSLTGIYKNTLSFTPNGVHIYRKNTIMWSRYDKLIPYNKIISIEYVKPSFMNGIGYLSIITRTDGIKGLRAPYSMNDTSLLSTDQNTITFRKSSKKIAESVYTALNELCLEQTYNIKIGMQTNPTFQDINDNIFVEFSGHDFEYYCADILKNNNFSNVQVTKGSGDQGVDILATKDGIRYAIQCKYYQSPVGNTAVQEVNSGKKYYKCHVGVVMTNSTFTKSAIELAEVTNILLWDGNYISKLNSSN